MPRVLIVDDSPTARLALRTAIDGQAGITVISEAADGKTALSLAKRHDPDLITMDVLLADEDGVEVTRRMMSEHPVPIIIVTASDPRAPRLVFRAMDAGAMELVAKLPAPDRPQYAELRRALVRKIVSLAGVPVVTRVRRDDPRRQPATVRPTPVPVAAVSRAPELVALALSTGGPPVLEAFLRALPHPFPVPIAIVQHVAFGFAEGLVRWLGEVTGHAVSRCLAPTQLEPGRVYLAPDDRHLRVLAPRLVIPDDGPTRCFQRPSADVLFETAAEVFGPAVFAGIFTGMGRDGSEGLAALKRAGAFTAAQLPSSCVVDSMPRSAIELDAVDLVATPAEIAALLRSSVRCG